MSEISARTKVAVLGSLVFDIAVTVDRVPETGETVLATSAQISAGGKGLCQAVAARRLGASVDAIGLIGSDVFGDYLTGVLRAEDIGHEHVRTHAAGTHLGIPIVTPDGNNRIIGVPRASLAVAPDDVAGSIELLQAADVLLLQGETPLECIRAALEGVGQKTLVVWNPAPARFTLEEMLAGQFGDRVSWLTPNESEATTLTGLPVVDVETGIRAARGIHERFPTTGVVVTLGAQGSVAIQRDGAVHVTAPFPVSAVDPTAAGDSFSAAFGVALANGESVVEALSFASAAGALTATQLGAVTAIPHITQVRALVNELAHS